MCVGTRREKQQPAWGMYNLGIYKKHKLAFSRYKRRERHSRGKGTECAVARRHAEVCYVAGIMGASVWSEMEVGCDQVDRV